MIFDVNHDEIAVKEAQKSKVKIVGVVDTNSSPVDIAYPIPCNDDAIQAIQVVAESIADAINEGKKTVVPNVVNANFVPAQAPTAE